jgi:hypothetical protein
MDVRSDSDIRAFKWNAKIYTSISILHASTRLKGGYHLTEVYEIPVTRPRSHASNR